MNIVECIPMGRNNPRTREELCDITGMDDRAVREAIRRAKREYPIVNVGKGYYIAVDPDDPNLAEYIRKEMHRIKEISKGLRWHKKLYHVNKNQINLNI